LVGVIEFEADGIVVVVEDAAAIDFEEAVVGDLLFEVKAFDAAEDVAGQAGAALEGSFVAIDESAADAEFDPVVEFGTGSASVSWASERGCRGEEQGGDEGQTVEALVGGEGGRDRVHGSGVGLEAKGGVDLGTVNGFVATRVPAGAALEEGGVVEAADEDLAAGRLLLEMALKAEGGIALGEEPGIDGAVGMMAGGAAFAHGFVFEDVGTALGGMALVTGFVFGEQRGVSAQDGIAMMRIVAIGAGQMTLRAPGCRCGRLKEPRTSR
jgi:hypothetical protein